MPERPSLLRRASAVLALASPVVAVVVVTVSVLNDPFEAVAAVALLSISVVAGWSALLRRGWRRAVFSAVAVGSLAAIMLLPDLRTYVVLATVMGMALLHVFAAKVAFGGDFAPLVDSVRVGPAKRGVLLVNPRSGGGKAGKFALARAAAQRGVSTVELHPGDDLRQLAERAAEHADVLGMAGGDGSLAVIADVARRHDLPFVCVPAGTRNHFALDLGLDHDEVTAALNAFGEAVERRGDLGLLGDRVFVNNASLGVYASVIQSPQYRDAKVATVAQELLVNRFELRYSGLDGAVNGPADLVLVSNGAYRLDRLSGFGARERLDRGVLGIVTVVANRKFRGYRSWQTREFVVDAGTPLVEVGLDGEALRLPPPLRFRSLPGALRVRLPLDAPRASPAALAPREIGEVFGGLLRVLWPGHSPATDESPGFRATDDAALPRDGSKP